MRSRVIPGSSPTIERRDRRMALNRVDLPTFGRPTITTEGRVGTDTTMIAHRGGERMFSLAAVESLDHVIHGLAIARLKERPHALGLLLVRESQHPCGYFG